MHDFRRRSNLADDSSRWLNKYRVLCHPVRTAIGTFNGTLKATPATELGATVVRETVRRSGLDVRHWAGACGAASIGARPLELKRRRARGINEAFAAVPLAVLRELGLPEDIANVDGGAIAHGHPIGATGAVLTTRLLHSMRRDGRKRGVVTLCIGGGQGIALALEML